MDPDATLSEIRERIAEADTAPTLARANVLMEEACELFVVLDNWLTGGGFLPDDWTQKPTPATPYAPFIPPFIPWEHNLPVDLRDTDD